MKNSEITYGLPTNGNGFSGDYNDLTNKPAILSTTEDLPDSEDKRYVTDEQKNNIHDPETQNNAIASKVTLAEVKADTDIADAINKKHSNSLDHASHSDDQDLSGKVDKVIGKELSTNDLTNELKTSYDDAVGKAHDTHSIDDITGLQTALDGKADIHTHPYEPVNANIQAHVESGHAPSNAQKNSDILKSEIEAKLIGEITSHSHAGSGGGAIVFLGDIFKCQ